MYTKTFITFMALIDVFQNKGYAISGGGDNNNNNNNTI